MAIKLITLLTTYILSPIYGDVLWATLQTVWSRITNKTLGELYRSAFQKAFTLERDRLSKFNQNGDVVFDEEAFNKALQWEMPKLADELSLSELKKDEFVNLLAQAFYKHNVLIIGGHTLTENDYKNLAEKVIIIANETFEDDLVKNDIAFRETVLRELGNNWRLLEKLNTEFREKIGITDKWLATCQRKLDEQGKKLDNIQRDVSTIAKQSSIEQDIRKLKDRTNITIHLTHNYSFLRIGSEQFQIERPISIVLRETAEQNSLLVVGEPGVGKSGVLHELVKMLISDGKDVVYLTLDSLPAGTLTAIQNDLQITNDLIDVLNQWDGDRQGFVIFDALDAARSGDLSKGIRDLIDLILSQAPRWIVVASIRKYDLRYGQRWKELFAGTPPTEFVDTEFTDVRHINIPLLSQDELDQVANRFRAFSDLLKIAPESVQRLLYVPFNLNLIGSLLVEGISETELTLVHTQIELLEKFWEKRVRRDDGNVNAREALLQIIIQKMVNDQELRISRAFLRTHAPQDLYWIEDLLLHNILEEIPEVSMITFSHNILYDYAIARLLLRGTAAELIEKTANNRTWVITIRPSILLHFQFLWQRDTRRKVFWENTFEFISSASIPDMGKLIPSSVVADFTNTDAEIELLKSAIYGEKYKKVARRFLQHVIVILKANRDIAKNESVIAFPWYTLAENLSEQLDEELVYSLHHLLSLILDNSLKITNDQIQQCGLASRRLLTYLWNQPVRNGGLARRVINMVCQTFSSDPDASSNLIKEIIEPVHIQSYGYEEISEVGRFIPTIAHYAPDLARDIYIAAFSYKDTSTENTHFGSQIISLISTRSQDYEMGLYILAEEAFSEFLRLAPLPAIEALITILRAHINSQSEQYERLDFRDKQKYEFQFLGQTAFIRRDLSSMLFELGRDEPQKMLGEFANYLNVLASRNEISILHHILVHLTQHNDIVVVWQHVLRLGITYPEKLGIEMRELGWAKPMMIISEIRSLYGQFVREIYQYISSEDRRAIEQAIMAVEVDENSKPINSLRQYILQFLPLDLIESPEVVDLVKQFASENGLNEFKPPEFYWPENRESKFENLAEIETIIINLISEVNAFLEKARNTKPSQQDIQIIYPTLQSLLANSLSKGNVRSEIVGISFEILITASETMVSNYELSCDSEVGEFVRGILLAGSNHPEPIYSEASEEHFNKSPSWGPAPRINAANGLMYLSRNENCYNQDIVSAIQKLSNDPVPAVRFQIAQYCNALINTDPELCWSLIEQFALEENNVGVLQGLLQYPLRKLLPSNVSRVVDIVGFIYERNIKGTGADEVRERCARIFLDAYLLFENSTSYSSIQKMVAAPTTCNIETHRILVNLRDSLNVKFSYSVDERRAKVYKKAIALLNQIAQSVLGKLRDFIKLFETHQTIQFSDEEHKVAATLVNLINTIGMEIYSASGAFAEKHNKQGEIPNLEEKVKYFKDVEPVLESLVEISGINMFGHRFGSMTYKIVEFLEAYVHAAPSKVLYWLGKFVRAGRKTDFQYESMAVTCTVEIIELYLADYKEIIQNEHQETVIDILDAFIEGGWPEAIRMANRLNEIFR